MYRRFWYKSLQNINFDNPVYRKTTTSASSGGGMTASSSAVSASIMTTEEPLSALSSVLASASASTQLSSLASSSLLASVASSSEIQGSHPATTSTALDEVGYCCSRYSRREQHNVFDRTNCRVRTNVLR